MNKKYIIEELKKGICNIILKSEQSPESYSFSATLDSYYLPSDMPQISNKPKIIVLWNITKKKWQSVHVSFIKQLNHISSSELLLFN